MDGGAVDMPLMINRSDLDRLMPMHLAVSEDGRIVSHGPTLGKVFHDQRLIGEDLFSVVRLRRPGGIQTMTDLQLRPGQRLQLHPIGRPDDVLRGLCVPMSDGGLLLNLSFGINVIDGTRRHSLTDADFAATDLTVELMYVMEAKSAVTTELRQMNVRLQGAKVVAEEQAMTDTLTGLRNRRAADATLAALCEARADFSLIHMDLDYFKAVNDTLGHAAGDHVLKVVAQILAAEIRGSDTAARVGGDEFVVILPGIIDPERLQVIAHRIIVAISEPMAFESASCQVSASIGMTRSVAYDLAHPDQMMADADAALYASKHAGRAQARLYMVEHTQVLQG
jgi:diguanylate cyclase (GGDEF)-like protein